MKIYSILEENTALRISDRQSISIINNWENNSYLLVIILSQLGDFDSLEYVWWLQREAAQIKTQNITIRAVGIGDYNSGVKFCQYTGFPPEYLLVDEKAEIHRKLGLYQGLNLKLPLLSPTQNAFLNLMFMCAGIASPGTLAEVFRGYKGDRTAPQLIDNDEEIYARPLPALKGSFFNLAGGSGFQRPFELATLRLRNMTEVLSNWDTFVPNGEYLTQRGGTFLFDQQKQLIYEHRDKGILGFAENMSHPLSFLKEKLTNNNYNN